MGGVKWGRAAARREVVRAESLASVGAVDAQQPEREWRFNGAGDEWDKEVERARRMALAGNHARYCSCLAAEVLGELLEVAMECGAELNRGTIEHAGELVDVFARPELAALGLSLKNADLEVALLLLERHWFHGPELTLVLGTWDYSE